MGCNRLTDESGNTVGFICGPGRFTHLVKASCPFCCLGKAQTVHAFRIVFGGWCAPDLICGRCGQDWSFDDKTLRKRTEHEREGNRELIGNLRAAGKKVGRWPKVCAP